MILIGTDSGIYRWIEGSGWPTFHALQDRSIVGLAAPGAGVLVAVDRNGALLESANNGLDWREVPLPHRATAPTALTVWGMPPAILLAIQGQGLYRRPVGAPITRPGDAPAGRGFGPAIADRARSLAQSATALVAPGSRTNLSEATFDEAYGWTRLGLYTSDGRGLAPRVRVLATASGSPATWFAAVPGSGLWRSRDVGASWQLSTGLPNEVLAIRTAPERPGSVFAATADGCWISADNGDTWEDRSGGLEKTRYLSAIEVKPGEPDVLLAGAAPRDPNAQAAASPDGLEFSLYESSNGGKSWTLVRRGNPDGFEHDTITDIRYDVAAPDNVVMALASGELWLTRNGGAYWSPLARQIRAARAVCSVG